MSQDHLTFCLLSPSLLCTAQHDGSCALVPDALAFLGWLGKDGSMPGRHISRNFGRERGKIDSQTVNKKTNKRSCTVEPVPPFLVSLLSLASPK
uniref:Putative secreted peptide n=1 Tax=Anopheles braziliensis TaxID=58242 RepID=A0A2M3ZX11_9DIPT